MKQVKYKVISNSLIARDVYKLILEGDVSDVTKPGQFVDIQISGFYLRRPISVCNRILKVGALGSKDGSVQPPMYGRLTLIYKIFGKGTDALSKVEPGATLDVLIGLGNGYNLKRAGKSPLLVGGGVGTPPLYWLARKLVGLGATPQIVLGFNTAQDIFYYEEFCALGCPIHVATADGSFGTKGFVTDILPESYTYFYACGPLPMLKALNKVAKGSGQFSLEERMGCGFGACMGCTIETNSGPKRVCKEGPVFYREDLKWER